MERKKLLGAKVIAIVNFLFASITLLVGLQAAFNYKEILDLLGIIFFGFLCIAFIQLGLLTRKQKIAAIRSNKLAAIIGFFTLFPITDLLAVLTGEHPEYRSFAMCFLIFLFLYYAWIISYFNKPEVEKHFG